MQLHVGKHHVDVPQTLLAADEILDVTILLLRYIQSMDKEINVCDLCPLK